MNDHELSAALRSFHVERTQLPDPPQLHERVLATRFDDIGQRRSWLPLPSAWRFGSMFSAAKYVTAGVIVALFGGLLLSGALPTRPADETAPAAVSTTAATMTLPSEAPIEQELLPGLSLETQEVAPGIYRILSDGDHDLRHDVWDVAITPEGEVWVEQHRVTYRTVRRRSGRLRTRYDDARIVQLGVPGSMYEAPDARSNWPIHLDVESGIPVVGGSGIKGRVWRDGSWHKNDLPYCEGLLTPDAACWSAYPPDVEAGFTPVKRTDLADRSERIFTRDDLGLDAGEVVGYRFAVGPDGTVWAGIHDGVQFQFSGNPDTFAGLASYDGERWTAVEAPPMGIDIVERLAVAPNGDVWVAGLDVGRDGALGGDLRLVIARYDGQSWEVFAPLDGDLAGFRDVGFAPDGTVWFDPVTYFDGTDVRRLQLPGSVAAGEVRVGEYAHAPDGSIWVVLIDMKRPDELGCEAQQARCEGDPGLYVITPEAVSDAAA